MSIKDNNTPDYTLLAQSEYSTVVAEYTPIPKTDGSYQSEAQLEDSFIKQLQRQEYEYAHITTTNQLLANLRTQIEILNNTTLTDSEWDRLYTHQIAASNLGIKGKTQLLQHDNAQLLLQRDDGSHKNIILIDRKRIHRNHLQVINQYTPQGGTHQNRYDVTILINGLPITHIELKRRGASIKEAFNQIDRYQRESFWADTGLWEYIQIFIISNGTETRYYANTTRIGTAADTRKTDAGGYKFTMQWADATNTPIMDLEDFTATFLQKRVLLTILTRYCIYNTSQQLMIMRPYQIAATEKILERINTSTHQKTTGTLQAGGYIWHTTGSGKTLTSFKAAQLAKEHYNLDKVLFVVDRQDLDYKTMKDFNQYAEGSVSATNNTRQLQKTLEDPNQRIVVTTIQKLARFIKNNTKHPIYTQHVALIFDECHRSQFGSMHQAITKHFRNYHLFGFTGTPIFTANAASGGDIQFKTTAQAFGDCLHRYTIIDAGRDRTVLPFRIEYYSTMEENVQDPDTEIPAIDKQAALLDQRRINNIVDHIIKHYDQQTQRSYTYRAGKPHRNGYNSILAVSSVDAAKLYYDTFKKHPQVADIPEDINTRPTPGQKPKLKIATIYSFAPNEAETAASGQLPEENFDPTALDSLDKTARQHLDQAINDYNKLFQTNYSTDAQSFSGYYKDISQRLEQTQIDILIVVNMFLTGFDAKRLNTLWVDKNLQYHGLIQAFSRTNRIYDSSKAFGNIICYRNLQPDVEKALALFGNEDASGTIILRPYHEYHTDYLELIHEITKKYQVDRHIDDYKDFVTLFGKALKLRNILTKFDQFTEDQRGITERRFNDYTSRYLSIREELRDTTKTDKTNINDDITFEIGLVKRQEITLDTILELVDKYQNSTAADREIIIADLRSKMLASPTMRPKIDLIEDFLQESNPQGSFDDIFPEYITRKRNQELNTIIHEENLNKELTHQIMEEALRVGYLQTYGPTITQILPRINRFTRPDDLRELRTRVYDKLRKVLERYKDL